MGLEEQLVFIWWVCYFADLSINQMVDKNKDAELWNGCHVTANELGRYRGREWSIFPQLRLEDTDGDCFSDP